MSLLAIILIILLVLSFGGGVAGVSDLLYILAVALLIALLVSLFV